MGYVRFWVCVFLFLCEVVSLIVESCGFVL
jgi:hypothetical protein